MLCIDSHLKVDVVLLLVLSCGCSCTAGWAGAIVVFSEQLVTGHDLVHSTLGVVLPVSVVPLRNKVSLVLHNEQ